MDFEDTFYHPDGVSFIFFSVCFVCLLIGLLFEFCVLAVLSFGMMMFILGTSLIMSDNSDFFPKTLMLIFFVLITIIFCGIFINNENLINDNDCLKKISQSVCINNGLVLNTNYGFVVESSSFGKRITEYDIVFGCSINDRDLSVYQFRFNKEDMKKCNLKVIKFSILRDEK